MKRLLWGLLTLACLSASCGVIKVTKGESNPGILIEARNLGFEEGVAGDGDPNGWDRRGGEPESYLFAVDTATFKSGKASVLIRSKPDAANPGSIDTSLIQCLEPEGFIGKEIHFNGWIKTSEASGQGAALWIGVYLTKGSDHGWFPTEDSHWRKGTLEWARYESKTAPVEEDATQICVGPILYGPGTAWFDELELRAVEQPID